MDRTTGGRLMADHRGEANGEVKLEVADRETAAVRYALVFRTHSWDDFVERQFDRVRLRARSADIFVLVDETRGKIPNIGADHVVSVTNGEILAAGLVLSGVAPLGWR